MNDDRKDTQGPEPESRESLEQAAMQDQEMQEIHDQLLREKEEPSEGFSPVPIVLIFLFSAMCFWGGVYMVEYSGGYRWDAYSPDYDPDAETAEPEELTLVERGARIYRNQCSQCHQPDGSGIDGVYPPLDGTRWVNGDEERLAKILISGLNGPVQVQGNEYNGNMPAFGPNGSDLRPREIAAVLSYVRQEWSNDSGEITEEAMSGYINDYGDRGSAWTAEELLADHPMEE